MLKTHFANATSFSTCLRKKNVRVTHSMLSNDKNRREKPYSPIKPSFGVAAHLLSWGLESHLTQVSRMRSFSLPWNESTLATSISA